MMTKKICLIVCLGIFIFHPVFLDSKPDIAGASKAQQELEHEVTVTLKLVQVYITDKQGNAVTDLKKEDFILYDNNGLQTITDFELHLLSPVSQTTDETLALTETEPPRSISDRMNRKFLFLFDLSRNSLAGLSRSKKAALHILDTLVEGTDEIGVISFSEFKGLILHEYLSSDFSRIKAGIDGLKEIVGKPSQSGLSLSVERARAEAGIGGGKGGGGPPASTLSTRLERASNPQSEASMLKNYDFMTAMQEMAKSFRYIEGYKNIIFFSYGFSHQLWEKDLLFRETYEDMAAEFATSNSPVFGIDTMGTKVRAGGNASLQKLSKISGGQYFESVVQYEAIADGIRNLTGNYYVLGYYISEQTDGKYHEIKVKVSRPGCQVHAQSGYFNPKPFPEFSQLERNLHLIDLAMSERPQHQEAVRFSMQALPYLEGEKTEVVFLSEISASTLEDISKQKAELITLVFDQDNNIVVSSRGEINLASLPPRNIFHYTLSSLLPGEYQCRIVLRNLKTGRGAVASSSLAIPEPEEKSFKLYAPMLLVPNQPAHFLKVSQDEVEKDANEKRSLKDIYPFVSESLSPLISSVSSETRKILAVLRCQTGNLSQPDIKISASLTEDKGKEHALNFKLLEAKELKDCDVLLLELDLPELVPGDYSLDIRAIEHSSSQESRVTQKIKVSPGINDQIYLGSGLHFSHWEE